MCNKFDCFQIFSCLMFHNGAAKNDFDNRWKSRRIVKKALGNKVELILYVPCVISWPYANSQSNHRITVQYLKLPKI